MTNLDATQYVNKDQLIMDPCPFYHIEQALPWDIYDQLISSYPEQHMMQDGKTHFQARRYRQHEFDPTVVSPLWQDFVNYHNSVDYKNRILDLFEPALEKYYGGFVNELKTATTTARHTKQDNANAIEMEVQFVLNGLQDTTVRTIHLDNSRELFAGLLYMRKPEDTSIGGDLQIFRQIRSDPEFHGIREVNPAHVTLAATVPYRANSMVLFLNTKHTLHGVSPRINANCFRRYINIDAHQSRKLFVL